MAEKNEAMEKVLLHISQELGGLYADGKQFMADQAPELAKEIVRAEIASDTICLLGVGALMVMCWLYFKRNEKISGTSNGSPMGDMLGFFSGIGMFIFAGLAVACANDLVCAVLAPRLVILHTASKLIH